MKNKDNYLNLFMYIRYNNNIMHSIKLCACIPTAVFTSDVYFLKSYLSAFKDKISNKKNYLPTCVLCGVAYITKYIQLNY